MWCASRLVGASLLKFLEGFVFVSGMNALNVKVVKAHWHECSIETMPTYILYMQTFSITKDLPKHCFASRPVGEASAFSHFIRRQNWRATGLVNNSFSTNISSCGGSSGNNWWPFGDCLPWSDFLGSFPNS